MAYEIVMPQLSDSMEEGKLISWKVHEGDFVKKGDVIAEVESDKAIMEVQSFKEGKVTALKVKEGESVPVGTVIAEIETEVSQSDTSPSQKAEKAVHETPATNQETTKEEAQPQQTEKPKPEPKTTQLSKPATHSSILDEILGFDEEYVPDTPTPHTTGTASPKAKILAQKYNIDIEKLQKEGKLPTPVHEKEIEAYYRKHLFTPKALKLIELYHLDPTLFETGKKHDSSDILNYIKTHDIPLPKPIEPFQKALIKAVETSAQKPTYYLFDTIDISELKKHKKYTFTVSLLKLFAKALMLHEAFRSTLKENSIVTYPNASIALAVAHENYLYMPVFKDINLKTEAEIAKELETFETKAKTGTMRSEDMEGSTFAISNLGMFGIERFTAMINKNDSAIAAIGSAKESQLSVTLTLDHRLINGAQAAQFIQTLKSLALDPMTYKE